MSEEQQRYLSYLLRLWQTGSGKEVVWRASLESPGTGERQGFASLEALIDFLEAQIESQKGQKRHPDTSRGGAGGDSTSSL